MVIGQQSVVPEILIIKGLEITDPVVEKKVWEYFVPDPRLRKGLMDNPINYRVVKGSKESPKKKGGMLAGAITYQCGDVLLWISTNGSRSDTRIILEFDAVLVVGGREPTIRKACAIYPRYSEIN